MPIIQTNLPSVGLAHWQVRESHCESDIIEAALGLRGTPLRELPQVLLLDFSEMESFAISMQRGILALQALAQALTPGNRSLQVVLIAPCKMCQDVGKLYVSVLGNLPHVDVSLVDRATSLTQIVGLAGDLAKRARMVEAAMPEPKPVSKQPAKQSIASEEDHKSRRARLRRSQAVLMGEPVCNCGAHALGLEVGYGCECSKENWQAHNVETAPAKPCESKTCKSN